MKPTLERGMRLQTAKNREPILYNVLPVLSLKHRNLVEMLRVCLDPLSFYKIWFLAIAYKNWVGMFEDQFLKTVNQFLLTSF
jgi:hypothetical protein